MHINIIHIYIYNAYMYNVYIYLYISIQYNKKTTVKSAVKWGNLSF